MEKEQGPNKNLWKSKWYNPYGPEIVKLEHNYPFYCPSTSKPTSRNLSPVVSGIIQKDSCIRLLTVALLVVKKKKNNPGNNPGVHQ